MKKQKHTQWSKLSLCLALGLAYSAAAAAANADIGGQSSSGKIIRVGAADVISGHPGAGEPGIQLRTGSSQRIISLSSISSGFTHRGATAHGYPRYGLENFGHGGRGPNLSHLVLDWAKVDYQGAAPVWFGVNYDKNLKQADAFYVGDRSDRVLPDIDTRYLVDAIIRVPTAPPGSEQIQAPSNSMTAPAVQYVSGEVLWNALDNMLTTPVPLRGEHSNFSIQAMTNSNGHFSGSSWYDKTRSSIPMSGDKGELKGEFFGGGTAKSAIAGIADGGEHYQAAFGGVAQ